MSRKFDPFPCEPLAGSISQPDVAAMSDMERMMRGYGLTTAKFFYRLPDFQSVLNEFIWQFYDVAPDHPTLFEKIEWWQANLDGPLHSVSFDHRKMLSAGDWRRLRGEFVIQ